MALVVDVLSRMSCHHQHGFCMHHRLGVEALKKFIASRHDPRLFFGQIDLIFVLWSRFRRFGFGFCSTRLFTLSPTKSREDIKDRYSWPMRNAVLAAPDRSLYELLISGLAVCIQRRPVTYFPPWSITSICPDGADTSGMSPTQGDVRERVVQSNINRECRVSAKADTDPVALTLSCNATENSLVAGTECDIRHSKDLETYFIR